MNQHIPSKNRYPKVQPIYFPYTFISSPVMNRLKFFFREMHVFQPIGTSLPDHLTQEVDQGFLKIIIPENIDEKKVSRAWKDFNDWGRLMGKNSDLKTVFFRFKNNEVPFYSDMSSLKILSDIKRGPEKRVDAQSMDPFYSSLLFLYMAQNYDAQAHEISEELVSVDNMEKELFKNMMGTADSQFYHASQIKPWLNEAPEDQMLKERVAAWSQLFLENMSLKGNMMAPFFVTSNKMVIPYLADAVPELEVVAKYHPIPVLEDDADPETKLHEILLNDLGDLAHDLQKDASRGKFPKPTSDKNRQSVSLTVYAIPAASPVDFCSNFAKPDAAKLRKLNEIKGVKNTLVGLISEET